jgi:hypothetical protein
MSERFLHDGPGNAPATILLAHGAGAPMDSASMTAAAKALAAAGLRVARFEFAYMAARRTGGSRKPPPRAEKLKGEYLAAVEELAAARPLIIGGKSMGGRVVHGRPIAPTLRRGPNREQAFGLRLLQLVRRRVGRAHCSSSRYAASARISPAGSMPKAGI